MIGLGRRTARCTGALRAGGALAALGCAAALATGCGSSASSTVDPVALAADTTTHAGGAHIALSGSIGVGSLTLSMSGSGAVDLRDGEGTFAMTVAGLPPQLQSRLHGSTLQMLELLKAGTLYLSSPLFDGHLPGGARWLKLDIAHVGQSLGLNTSSLTGGTDPTQYLKDLRGAGAGVAVIGREDVRGVATTHYRATIDLVKAAEAAAPSNRAQARAGIEKLIAKTGQATLPVEAWVDGKGLVRRVDITLSQGAVTSKIRTEYFDFGPVPAVTVPSGSDVFDATGQALSALGASG